MKGLVALETLIEKAREVTRKVMDSNQHPLFSPTAGAAAGSGGSELSVDPSLPLFPIATMTHLLTIVNQLHGTFIKKIGQAYELTYEQTLRYDSETPQREMVEALQILFKKLKTALTQMRKECAEALSSLDTPVGTPLSRPSMSGTFPEPKTGIEEFEEITHESSHADLMKWNTRDLLDNIYASEVYKNVIAFNVELSPADLPEVQAAKKKRSALVKQLKQSLKDFMAKASIPALLGSQPEKLRHSLEKAAPELPNILAAFDYLLGRDRRRSRSGSEPWLGGSYRSSGGGVAQFSGEAAHGIKPIAETGPSLDDVATSTLKAKNSALEKENAQLRARLAKLEAKEAAAGTGALQDFVWVDARPRPRS